MLILYINRSTSQQKRPLTSLRLFLKPFGADSVVVACVAYVSFVKNPLKSSSEHKTVQLTYFAREVMSYPGSWLAPKRKLLFSQCRDFCKISTLWKADRLRCGSAALHTALLFFVSTKNAPSFYSLHSWLFPKQGVYLNERKVGEIKFSTYLFPFFLHTQR